MLFVGMSYSLELLQKLFIIHVFFSESQIGIIFLAYKV